MAEGLSTVDGEDLALDRAEQEFAAAMAAPPADGPAAAAPAKRPPRPADDPDAAPHGWTWADGEWRPKKAPGRPSTAGDKPRVTTGPAAPAKAATAKPGPKAAVSQPARDYRKTVAESVEALWFVLATTPVPDKAFGLNLAGVRTRLRVQAALLESNVDGLTNGLNTLGQHNKMVGRALDRLASGEGGLWVLPACMMLAPFVAQTGQLWAGQLDGQVDMAAVAAQVEERGREYVAKLGEATAKETTGA